MKYYHFHSKTLNFILCCQCQYPVGLASIQPINPAGFLLVDDEDCPNVESKGGNKDGKVGNGEGDGDAVHDGGLPAHEAEVQISPQ